MYQFNPNTHSFIEVNEEIEVKDGTRYERIMRTRVPRWVMLLITFVPPLIFAIIVFTGCEDRNSGYKERKQDYEKPDIYRPGNTKRYENFR